MAKTGQNLAFSIVKGHQLEKSTPKHVVGLVFLNDQIIITLLLGSFNILNADHGGVINTQDNCHHLNDHHRNNDQEIPFYEWAGAPVYPEFEFQMFTTKVDNHCSVIKMDFKSK